MRLHRFFTEQKVPDSGDVAVTNKALAHQLKNVFRLGAGSSVILFDGTGFDFTVSIESFEGETISFHVVEKNKNTIVSKRVIHLFHALTKKDTTEWVIQKGTELGVMFFHPIISERSEKKNFNVERARKIMIEAVEQSGRDTVPKIFEPQKFSAVFPCPEFTPIAFDSSGQPFQSENFRDKKSLAIFVGPEGGWSDAEKKIFSEDDVPLYSLGPATLRAETAAIVSSALLLL